MRDYVLMRLSELYKNKYLIYTRKSTDDADNQKNSIAYQKSEAMRFCRSENISIADITIDDFCTSGIIVERHTGYKESTFFKVDHKGVQHTIERPKFHKLVELLWNGSFKGVIILCWDRASRNKSDNAIIERLMAMGRDIKFVQAQYDSSSAGKLHMDIDGTFAQHYSRIISEKVKQTNKKMRGEGICNYRAPVGYLNTGNPREKPFDSIRAPLVKMLFEKYAEGNWSLSDLVKWANDQGLTMPPKRRKRTEKELMQDEELIIEASERPLTINQLHSLLRNPFYTGKIKGADKKYISSISHKALIDERLFNIVQVALKQKRVSVHYIEKLEFPYRGLIRCGSCARVYSPYEQKGIHYYGARCTKACINPKRNINSTFIEQKISAIIKFLCFTDRDLGELNSRIQSGSSELEEEKQLELTQLERQKKKVIEDIAYLNSNKLILLKTGAYSPEDYLNEESSLKERISSINEKIENSQVSIINILEDVVKLSELLKELDMYNWLANSTEKLAIITAIFSELKLKGETLNFQCKKGFQLLANHSLLLGAPNTRLSELFAYKVAVKESINDLEYLINNKLSTASDQAA